MAESDGAAKAPEKSLTRRLLIGDWSLKRLLISLGSIYGGLALFAALASERLIFQPPRSTYTIGGAYEELPLPDGRKVGLRVFDHPQPRATVLFSHGNAEDIGMGASFYAAYAKQGYRVVLYDYPGYGVSGGSASEAGCYAAADAAYDYVAKLGVAPERLILHGRSVGSGPTMYLATTRACAGVVLESPFLSTFRVAIPVKILPFDRFDNAARMGSYGGPLLVMHGGADEVVPFSHGERLFEMARGPKRSLFIPEAGHNDFAWTAKARYIEAIDGFVSELAIPKAATPAEDAGSSAGAGHKDAAESE